MCRIAYKQGSDAAQRTRLTEPRAVLAGWENEPWVSLRDGVCPCIDGWHGESEHARAQVHGCDAMRGRMDGWMDGWMGGWMDGWMDGWIDG